MKTYTSDEIVKKIIESLKKNDKLVLKQRKKIAQEISEDLDDADNDAEVDKNSLPVGKKKVLIKGDPKTPRAKYEKKQQIGRNRSDRGLREKGVHGTYENRGESMAGQLEGKDRKEEHANKLKELKAMPKPDLTKSNYGPKGGGQYTQADNERRKNSKKGNVADQEMGIQGIKVKTGANASGSQGKKQLDQDMKKLKAKNKKQPVKNIELSPKEKKAIEDRMNSKNKLKNFMSKIKEKRQGS